MSFPTHNITSTNSEAPPQYSRPIHLHPNSHQPAPQYDIPAEEDSQLRQQVSSLTQWIPQASAVQGHLPCSRLDKPIVIPRVDIARNPKPQPPFMRLYSPSLAAHDIDIYAFIAFVDNLVVAQAAPAPLKVLGVAGNVVGSIPSMAASLAGAGTSILAGTASAVISAKRTRRYLETVNREFFAPRGLKASIVKQGEVFFRLGVACDSASPLEDPLSDSPVAGLSMRERCMQKLAPYIAPLDSNVPPPSGQRSAIDQMTAKMADRERKGQEVKIQRKLEKTQEKESKIENRLRQYSAHNQREHISEEVPRSSSQKSESSTKEERKRIEARYKTEKDRQKKEDKAERKLAKLREKKHERISKEQEGIGRMEFLVVGNL